MSCYWWGSNRPNGMRRCDILHLLDQRMPCASNQVRWICRWMIRCVNHVPVVGYSFRLILLIPGIIIGWVWVYRAILAGFSIAIIGICHCSLQFHIYRSLTIGWLLRRKILCCWLVHFRWWPIGEIWSIVGGPGDTMVGDVVVPIFSLFSIGDVVNLRNIILVVWHVLLDWACQLMIPVCLY